MPREPGIDPHPDGNPGEDRAVAGAARDDHFRALIERAQPRLVAHHADDAHGAIDGALVELRGRRQRLDAAFAQAPLQVRLVLLGVDQRHGKGQLLLVSDLLDQLAEQRNVRRAARGSGGADE